MDEAEYYRLTGYPNSTTWLLSKMMWVRRNEPEVWKKTRRVVQMHDYFVRALGTEEYFVDLNDAGFFGFFDTAAGAGTHEILGLFDIPARDPAGAPAIGTPVAGRSPPRLPNASVCAAGTPVSVGAGDQSAGAVGAGIVQKGLRVGVHGDGGGRDGVPGRAIP